MLYNSSKSTPGKYNIRVNINKIWDSCNAELFVRWILHECETPLKTKKDILDHINTHRSQYKGDITTQPITILFNGLDPIYETVTINKLMDACFDRLDILNRKLISDKFIISQGIWLTKEEKLELRELNENGQLRNYLDVIKERLSLDPECPLRKNHAGLTYAEFRALVQLDNMPKISLLPTITLKVLRDKVLLLLDNDLNYHINKWHTLLDNISKVADARSITLPKYEIN